VKNIEKPRIEPSKIKCAVTGVLAGAANGFFGAGGGMFVIPLFTRWVKLADKPAYASSVAVILPLSAVSATVYLTQGGADWAAALPYLLGGAIGGLLGGKVFRKIPVKLLRRAFAVLLILGGLRSLLS
jgi:uncharacterized membrane protein YfcA